MSYSPRLLFLVYIHERISSKQESILTSHCSFHIFSIFPKNPHIDIRNPLVNSAGVPCKKIIHEFINLLVPSIYLKSYGQHAEQRYTEHIILKNNAISRTGKLLFPSGGEPFRRYRYGPVAECRWQGQSHSSWFPYCCKHISVSETSIHYVKKSTCNHWKGSDKNGQKKGISQCHPIVKAF